MTHTITLNLPSGPALVEFEHTAGEVTLKSVAKKDWCTVCVTFGAHDICPICGGTATRYTEILSTLSADTIQRLRVDCAEWREITRRSEE